MMTRTEVSEFREQCLTLLDQVPVDGLIITKQGRPLTSHERKILDKERWGISAIVLQDIFELRQTGRIALGLESPLLTKAIIRIHVWTFGAPLVTCDERIRKSRMVEFA